MTMFKIIAVNIEKAYLKGSLKVIRARKDTKVKTGTVLNYTEYEWVVDHSIPYTGGYDVTHNRTYDQERVVLNDEYNQRRMDALEKLARIGGGRALAALIGVRLKRTISRVEEHGGNGIQFVIDDMSFEERLNDRRNELARETLSSISGEQIRYLFEGDTGVVNRTCKVLHRHFPDHYMNILENLAENSPNDLVRLACHLRSVQQETGGFMNHEVSVMMVAVNDKVLANAELKKLVMLHYLAEKGSLREKIKRQVAKRITMKDAVALINMPHMGPEMEKVVFEFVAQNYTSPEMDTLRIPSFVNHVARVAASYMEGEDETVLVRKRYADCELVGGLPEFTYKKCIAQNRLRAVGVAMLEEFLPRIDQGLKRMIDRGHSMETVMNLLPVLDIVKSRASIEVLLSLAKSIIGGHPGYLSNVLMVLGEQDLAKGDVDVLENLYIKAVQKHALDEGSLELLQIAQLLRRLEPETVEKGRSLVETIRGQRPWAKRVVRKKLRELEACQRRIEECREMDEKVPYLFKIRGGMGSAPRPLSDEDVRVVVENLPQILDVLEENPDIFDYYDIIGSSLVVDRALEERYASSLRLFEALANHYYGKLDEFVFAREQIIMRLVSVIGELGNPEGIEVLKRIARKNVYSGLGIIKKASIRLAIRRAIRQLR